MQHHDVNAEHEHEHPAQNKPGDDNDATASVDHPGGDDGDVDDDDGIDEDVKAQARSERKRSREKQRRSDVNRQFADLMTLLKQIEADEAAEGTHVIARLAFSPTNRVEMIARTVTHLERLRAVNKRLKREAESLQVQLDVAKKAGEDTAAKLKEVMFNHPPAGPTKQVSRP